MTSLETQLRELRTSGKKALVIYLMAGVVPDWIDHLSAVVDGGADLVEIGAPFSDPIMDGVVIQQAATQALQRGTNLPSILDSLSAAQVSVPRVLMTYANVLHRQGWDNTASALAAAGLSGAILPDLPPEESAEVDPILLAHDVAPIRIFAPSTSTSRAALIASHCHGFAYAAASMSVTGKAQGIGSAQRVTELVRGATDLPVYVGIGITTPDDAKAAVRFADGAIVGSVIVRHIMNGGSPSETATIVRALRAAIDAD
jgi:tryptophan synthase alpha chain